MNIRPAPRHQGRITTWKDDQGFGFITPHGGGPAVFLHIKAIAEPSMRPTGDDIVTYHLTMNDKGQPRAENVAFVRNPNRTGGARPATSAISATPVTPGTPGAPGTPALPATIRTPGTPGPFSSGVADGLIGVFVLFLAASVLVGRLPPMVAVLYPVFSLLTFFVYGRDKAAARDKRWRTPESHLHLLAFVGGWPGALLAQRRFRHKWKKASFQSVFWLTVAGNCIALCWMLSTPGSRMLRTLLALFSPA